VPNIITSFFHKIIPRKLYRIGLLFISSGLALCSLILPIALRPAALPIQIGEVAPQNITAPRSITYESSILTKLAQEQAANAVTPRYLSPDPNIARTQIDNFQMVINYISSVRSDSLANLDRKILDLANIKQLPLSHESSEELILLSDMRWQTIIQESLNVLEQTLRKPIRDYQLPDTISNLSSLINLSIGQEQSQIILDLITPYIVANSIYSGEETILARQNAVDSIKPITRTYAQNQTIVLRGQIITDEQFEVLQYFGLVKPENKVQELIASSSIIVILVCFIVLYFLKRRLSILVDLKNLTVISLAFLIFLYGARFLIPNRAVIPYFYPLPAFSLILVTLFNLEIGIVFSLALSIISAFGLSNSLDLTIFYLLTSLIGALVLGKGRRVSSFFAAAIAIGFTGSAILLAYKLTDPFSDLVGLFTLVGVTFLSGFASASLALLIQYLLSQWLGITTPLHLLDISRPDHPLLKKLLSNAPGTYQHSLQVSNLAEQAAEVIGADSLLTRVGTLYHDIGKSENASFFVENQIPGKLNTHDDMDAVIAAQTIICHVSDGVTLADKYRIPPRIKDFIREHHGTQTTMYQYTRALENQNNDPRKVDIELFRYPGPKPRPKETGLLMLADGCEARARAD
jgi:putative nucleotidyltransferase with HDIG domain